MIVRAAVPGDGLAIETARVRGWQAAYRGLVPDEVLDAMDPADRAPRWDELLTDGRPIFLSETAGSVTGFVAVGPARDDDLAGSEVGEIRAIYTLPAAWGSGAGQALLSAGLGALGGVPVILWVLAGNARARAFYARNGFVPDGAAQGYETGGVVVPEVRLRLDP